MNQLGINLLVFKRDLDNGIEQKNKLDEIKSLGIAIAEIRREYLKNLDEELIEINKLAEKSKLEIYYSVPEKIALEKRVNPNLNDYFEEAIQMGSTHIKLNIGDLENLDTCEIVKLRDVINGFNIKVTIENDQTPENGTLKSVMNAITTIKKNSLPIGYTFDLGNWYWQNEDPYNAFDLLKSEVTVLHLKNINFSNGSPSTTLIEKGEINWKSILSKLAKDIPVIIEYPIEKNDILGEVNQVKKVLLSSES